MKTNDNCLVYITVKSKKEGLQIAKLAIEHNLAACGNLLPKMKSIFKWKNKLEVENEAVLILKTTNQNYKFLESFIKKNHSYETPCIIKLPIQDGSKDFLDWINETVKISN